MNHERISSSASTRTSHPGDTLQARRLGGFPTPRPSSAWHRPPCFEIHWIEEGEGELLSDLATLTLAPGVLVFISPGQAHQWGFTTPPGGHMVAFSPWEVPGESDSPGTAAELPFFFGSGAPSAVVTPQMARPGLSRDFADLTAECESDDPLCFEAARALLRLLLIRCQRVQAATGGHPVEEPAAARLARRFCWEVSREFLRRRQVRDYAARLQVTPNHLVETVREQFGRTPGEMIDERLYMEATRLLFHTSRNAAEIAYQLGFKTPSHFGAFFKRHAGCAPGEARADFFGRAGQMNGVPPIKPDIKGREVNSVAV